MSREEHYQHQLADAYGRLSDLVCFAECLIETIRGMSDSDVNLEEDRLKEILEKTYE